MIFRCVLLAKVVIFWRTSNTNDGICVCSVIQTSHDERKDLLLAPWIDVRGWNAIAYCIDQPQGQPRKDPRVDEFVEIRSLGQDYHTMPPHRTYVALVNDGRTLPDNGLVQGLGELQSLMQLFNAAQDNC